MRASACLLAGEKGQHRFRGKGAPALERLQVLQPPAAWLFAMVQALNELRAEEQSSISQ